MLTGSSIRAKMSRASCSMRRMEGSHRDIWGIIMSRIGRPRCKIKDSGRCEGSWGFFWVVFMGGIFLLIGDFLMEWCVSTSTVWSRLACGVGLSLRRDDHVFMGRMTLYIGATLYFHGGVRSAFSAHGLFSLAITWLGRITDGMFGI